MLSCKELVRDADALLDGGLPLRHRLALRLHLFVCVHCRRYLRQLRLMVGALRRRGDEPASAQEVDQVVAAVRRSRVG